MPVDETFLDIEHSLTAVQNTSVEIEVFAPVFLAEQLGFAGTLPTRSVQSE